MSLWGTADDKTSAGTVNVWANGQVVGSSTFFADPAVAAVGDFITIDGTGQNLRITSIESNTICFVEAGTAGESVANVGAGNAFALSEKPMYVSYYSIGSGAGQGAANVYGVSNVEMAANSINAGVQHAGWVRRLVSAGAGGTGERIRYETLVATRRISGDALDDSQFVDFYAAIVTQPSATTANLIANANASATFSVVADVRPVDANVQYYWQVSTDSGANWANVSNGAVYTGVKTATLNVAAPTTLDGNEYRVKINSGGTGHGFTEITSSNVILTVVE